MTVRIARGQYPPIECRNETIDRISDIDHYVSVLSQIHVHEVKVVALLGTTISISLSMTGLSSIPCIYSTSSISVSTNGIARMRMAHDQ